jgi:hypothetical protein
MLYGAHSRAKEAKKQIGVLSGQANQIRENMADNASGLREDLLDIDEDFQKEQVRLGENIGEKLEDASGTIGNIIQKGRGLLTGNKDIVKQDIIDDMGSFAADSMQRLGTQRGNQYSGLIDTHQRGVLANQQSLLNIASQQKDLERKDSFWENLIG